ncbi:MAG TPA: CehA/McbA family metallohydrolase [Syntrophales bacterium]|nr:CehA/McbA family metallohydrolase [Syntrophales bacterium]
MPDFYDYTGVIHNHSAYSFDGRASVEEILKAARVNGIDFVMLTDHSNLRAREDGFEGWHGDTLLIVGQEIAPRFNHYLAFQIETPVVVPEDLPDINPQTYINDVRARGGIGFIAHPDHEGTELFHVKHYPWLDWEVTDYTGMGIWDFMTDWQSSLTGYARSILSFLFPAFFLRGPRKKTLARWDKLNRTRKVVGIGELDNHDTPQKAFGLKFSVFPFAKAFKFMRTHVIMKKPFTRDSAMDIDLVLEALKQGKAYLAGEYYHKAQGFSFVLGEGGRRATIGDDFILEREAWLTVNVPATARIRLIKDGNIIAEKSDRELTNSVKKPGVYRVEVHLRILGRWLPWIFSNPIYVNKA